MEARTTGLNAAIKWAASARNGKLAEVLGANWKLIPAGHPLSFLPLSQRVVADQNMILLTQQEHAELAAQLAAADELEALNEGSEA